MDDCYEDIVSASEDEDTDDRKRLQLIDAISSLDGHKKQKLNQRTVPATQVSEFNFGAGGGDVGKVKLQELMGSLRDSVSHGELKKQLRAVEKTTKVVPVPLPKFQKEKIERSLAYEKTSSDMKQWDPVVRQNRKAEQIKFPLQQPDFRLHTTEQVVKRFTPRTPLEVEIAALLQGSDNVHHKNAELTPAEERALKAMSLEEARERRAELQKYRALMSYKEAKARWQKKIKSKRYHRVLRKERQKNEKKALEDLEKNDPEAYLDKLNEADKQRIQERMSLKHRGGSKFSQKQMIYAKYDDKARQQVQDMLQHSRELTQKLKTDEDESEAESEGGVSLDEEDERNMVESELGSSLSAGRNPWMSNPSVEAASVYSRPGVVQGERVSAVKDSDEEDGDQERPAGLVTESGIGPTSDSGVGDKESKRRMETRNSFNEEGEEKVENEIDEIFEQMTKREKSELSEDDSRARKKKKRKRKKKGKVNDKKATEHCISDKVGEVEEEENSLISEGLTRKRTLEEIEQTVESDESEGEGKKSPKKMKTEEYKGKGSIDKKKDKDIYVDPKKVFSLESKLKQTQVADVVDDEEEDVDPEEQQRMTIAQAFADDDVIEEFKVEKSAIVDRDKPKDIDLHLPGWGDWGGEGIIPQKKKKRRFRIKAPPAPPRKDMSLGNVIISEQKDKSIAKHQISELPFPFTSVKQFEQSIRAPVGKTWNPETAYKQLVKPKVVTKLGKIISPIDKSEVFKHQQKMKDKGINIQFGKSEKNKNKEGVKKQTVKSKGKKKK